MSTNISTQSVFPVEIVRRILSYSDPKDIIQWRTVSKQFQSVTYNTALWETLYKTSSVPLPAISPQTRTSLERTLVQSEQLYELWGGDPHVVSYKEIPFEGKTSGHANGYDLIGSRWFIVCQSQQRLVLFDTDADAHTPRILWEQEAEITFWSYCAMMPDEGQQVVYVRLRDTLSTHDKLLEFCLDGESGALCNTSIFDVPIPNQGQVIGGPSSPFIKILPNLLFDSQTHCFCRLPVFTLALDKSQRKTAGKQYSYQEVIFTSTHILMISHYSVWGKGLCVIQAFAQPADKNQSLDQDGIVILTQTHEAVFSVDDDDAIPRKPEGVFQNSTVDPTSGSTKVVLICQWASTESGSLIGVTLDAPSSTGIASLSTGWYFLTVQGRLPEEYKRITHHFLGMLPNGGHTRGIQIDAHNHPLQGEVFVGEFYMDFDAGVTTAWMGPFGSLTEELEGWTESLHWSGEFKSFDGMRGRLCYGWSDTRGSDHVAIIGLK